MIRNKTQNKSLTGVLWNFLLPFPMTILHLEGVAPVDGDVDIKQVLIDMATTIVAQ